MDTLVSTRLPAALVEALDKRAGDEFRSRANMLAALVRQALVESTEEKEVN